MVPDRSAGHEESLIAVGSTPRTIDYLRQIWDHRELIQTLAANDFRTRHSGTFLGAGWNLLAPLLMLGIYWLVFGVVLVGRRPENFLAFLAVGIFLFRFVQSSVKDAAGSIIKGRGLIRSVRFPRAVLPLADVARNALGFVWELPIVFLIVLLVTRDGPQPGWIVFLSVIVPMAIIFSAGVALLFARMATVIVDIRQLIPLFFRILFYLSGILFPIRAFVADHPLLEYLVVNPIYAFVTLSRHYILGPEPGIRLLWLSATVWTGAAALIGVVFFSRAEYRYGNA